MRALEPIFAALLIFAVTFLVLRGLEWFYHRWRRTPDWSPHWGSWVFAVLAALYTLVVSLGR